MQKVFIKAIINTLVGIFAAAVLTWAVITLAFPSSLVTVTANMGWTKVSAWYAASSYVRTRDLNDLALAVDMSINVVNVKKGKIELGDKSVTITKDDYGQVRKYCSILIRQDGFEDFCAERDGDEENEDYGGSTKNYYYTSLVEAYYNTGYKTDALARAILMLKEDDGVIDGSSAIFLLTYQAVSNDDVDFCKMIQSELSKSNVEENEVYTTLVKALSDVTGE